MPRESFYPTLHSKQLLKRGCKPNFIDEAVRLPSAESTARSMSAFPPNATWASTSSVAGSITSKVLPEWEGTYSLSIHKPNCSGAKRPSNFFDHCLASITERGTALCNQQQTKEEEYRRKERELERTGMKRCHSSKRVPNIKKEAMEEWLQDLLAMVGTMICALTWLKLMEFLSDSQILPSHTSRKLIHIGTGPM